MFFQKSFWRTNDGFQPKEFNASQRTEPARRRRLMVAETAGVGRRLSRQEEVKIRGS
jgi:hypothetical protein